jgi:undecaprenyl-diphosphatase
MELFDPIILGLVQGITEFLPISSTGHLILISEWLSLNTSNALAYSFVLHIATAIAVITYFWSDILVVIQVLLRKLSRLPVNERDLTLAYALLLGTIPAALIGFWIEPYVSTNPQPPVLVAGMVFVASVFFMYVEWRYLLRPTHESVSGRNGFWVGCFQALALVPGFSRTGATIAGGMLLGLSRYEAARFSFLLAIPISLVSGGISLISLLKNNGVVDWTPIIVGGVVAYAVALIVIHIFLSFIRRYTLWPFIWYGVILSGFIGYITFIS